MIDTINQTVGTEALRAAVAATDTVEDPVVEVIARLAAAGFTIVPKDWVTDTVTVTALVDEIRGHVAVYRAAADAMTRDNTMRSRTYGQAQGMEDAANAVAALVDRITMGRAVQMSVVDLPATA